MFENSRNFHPIWYFKNCQSAVSGTNSKNRARTYIQERASRVCRLASKMWKICLLQILFEKLLFGNSRALFCFSKLLKVQKFTQAIEHKRFADMVKLNHSDARDCLRKRCLAILEIFTLFGISKILKVQLQEPTQRVEQELIHRKEHKGLADFLTKC